MPTYPAPTRKHHLTFCQVEGWTEIRNAVGQPVRHHATFEIALPDGRILRTHISRPPNSKDTYGSSLWSRILRDQLQVGPGEFWACVQDGTKPDRGTPVAPGDTTPADVVSMLLRRGVSERDILSMGRAAAIQALLDLLAEPKQP
ncbi:MAG: cytotoxic translational repressor of toxin-antitoxin stability system [Micropruina sp.]|nr:cytotoxic translational repressor of toxin-antitoxin stability system [Micropruina sp.]